MITDEGTGRGSDRRWGAWGPKMKKKAKERERERGGGKEINVAKGRDGLSGREREISPP